MMVTVPSAATLMKACGLGGRLRAAAALRLRFGFE